MARAYMTKKSMHFLSRVDAPESFLNSCKMCYTSHVKSCLGLQSSDAAPFTLFIINNALVISFFNKGSVVHGRKMFSCPTLELWKRARLFKCQERKKLKMAE